MRAGISFAYTARWAMQWSQSVTDAIETTAPEVDVAALLAEVERLKSHHSKLLEETKTAKQRAAELDKASQDAEIARQTEQGEFKSLAEKYKLEVEAERKTASEFRAAIAGEKMELAAMRIATEEANDPKNAKLLARFIRDQLDYVDGKVVGKDGHPVEDVIKAMLATGDYESLRKGNQASGGSAPGSKTGSGADPSINAKAEEAKKKGDLTGFLKAQLS